MSHLPYSNYPGWGDYAKENFHYSQAVRIGNKIECSGQGGLHASGGWDRDTHDISPSLEAEIGQAFANVEAAVKAAGGAGWKHVYKVRSYHSPKIEEGVLELMVQNLKKWCPDHAPLWTILGVTNLGRPDMRVEIDVEAYVP